MPDRFMTIDVNGFDKDADDLVIVSFMGEETISRLFHYQVDLVSKDLDIQPSRLIGLNATITLARNEGAPRLFNGYISSISAGGIIPGRGRHEMYRNYRVEMVPGLWFLTQTSDCRVFNNPPETKLNVLSIIEEVLNDCPNCEFVRGGMLAAHEREIEYCVQYRETDFNFVSRLMEQFGFYYYFVHDQRGHKMVISDSRRGYGRTTDTQVDFAGSHGAHRRDHIAAWEHRFEFVSGRYAHTDYDFKRPSTNLRRNSGGSMADLTGNEQYQLFDYPGEYELLDDGKREAEVRIEAQEVRYSVVEGQGECRSFLPGHVFELVRHVAEEENGEYLLTSVMHSASQPGPLSTENEGLHYSNSFQCIPADTLYTTPQFTQQPVISGVQTALVVGPQGEEIHCDPYGRVRVRFHWEREGDDRESLKQPDERCTCWVRVASQVAGNKWGFVGIPRIGQEVVVDFLEGDPDRPLIVGSVYNAEQMQHYALPEHAAKTYIKTNSTKGGDGFNELMFDDQAGSERLFLHAQRDKDEMVNGESRETVGGSKHFNVGEELLERVEGKWKVQVGGSEGHLIGDQLFYDVKNMMSFKAGSERREVKEYKDLIVGGNYSTKIKGGVSQDISGEVHTHVKNDYYLSVDGTVNVQAGSLAVSAREISISAGGGNFITIGPAGINIVGSLVNINSGGAATAASPANPLDPVEAAEGSDHQPDRAWTSNSGRKSSKD